MCRLSFNMTLNITLNEPRKEKVVVHILQSIVHIAMVKLKTKMHNTHNSKDPSPNAWTWSLPMYPLIFINFFLLLHCFICSLNMKIQIVYLRDVHSFKSWFLLLNICLKDRKLSVVQDTLRFSLKHMPQNSHLICNLKFTTQNFNLFFLTSKLCSNPWHYLPCH